MKTYRNEHEMIDRYAILTELQRGRAQNPVAARGIVCAYCYTLSQQLQKALAVAEGAERIAEDILEREIAGGKVDRIIDAERAYRAVAERATNVRAEQITPGRQWQERTKEHHLAGRQKHRSICSRCGEDWQGVEVPVFQCEIQKAPRRAATLDWLDDVANEHGALEDILGRERRPRRWESKRWRFARLATLAKHHGDLGNVPRIVSEGRVVATEFGDWWDAEVVEYWIGRFEAKVRERGERARMLVRTRRAA